MKRRFGYTTSHILAFLAAIAMASIGVLVSPASAAYATFNYGTGVRDYIHVVDLARGHVAALENINQDNNVKIYNLGSGVGTSVLELIEAFSKACGKEIPYKVTDRRPGDIDCFYADATKANKVLGWKTSLTI